MADVAGTQVRVGKRAFQTDFLETGLGIQKKNNQHPTRLLTPSGHRIVRICLFKKRSDYCEAGLVFAVNAYSLSMVAYGGLLCMLMCNLYPDNTSGGCVRSF